MLDIDQIRSVLVVAAHADDEALGCGGTIAALSARGIAVRCAFVTDGVGARADGTIDSGTVSARSEAAKRANALLGSEIVYQGSLPDNQLDSVPLLQIVKIIEPMIRACNPQLVITHHAGDLNVDHRSVHKAVVTACRPLPRASVRGLAFFEVPSSTEWQTPNSAPAFSPNWSVDISRTLSIKKQALQAYSDEMREWPHSRSMEAIEHLARWRGASVGLEAAEAFVLGRWVTLS